MTVAQPPYRASRDAGDPDNAALIEMARRRAAEPIMLEDVEVEAATDPAHPR